MLPSLTEAVVWVMIVTAGNGNSAQVVGPYPSQDACARAATYFHRGWNGDMANCIPVGPVITKK